MNFQIKTRLVWVTFALVGVSLSGLRTTALGQSNSGTKDLREVVVTVTRSDSTQSPVKHKLYYADFQIGQILTDQAAIQERSKSLECIARKKYKSRLVRDRYDGGHSGHYEDGETVLVYQLIDKSAKGHWVATFDNQNDCEGLRQKKIIDPIRERLDHARRLERASENINKNQSKIN